MSSLRFAALCATACLCSCSAASGPDATVRAAAGPPTIERLMRVIPDEGETVDSFEYAAGGESFYASAVLDNEVSAYQRHRYYGKASALSDKFISETKFVHTADQVRHRPLAVTDTSVIVDRQLSVHDDSGPREHALIAGSFDYKFGTSIPSNALCDLMTDPNYYTYVLPLNGSHDAVQSGPGGYYFLSNDYSRKTVGDPTTITLANGDQLIGGRLLKRTALYRCDGAREPKRVTLLSVMEKCKEFTARDFQVVGDTVFTLSACQVEGRWLSKLVAYRAGQIVYSIDLSDDVGSNGLHIDDAAGFVVTPSRQRIYIAGFDALQSHNVIYEMDAKPGADLDFEPPRPRFSLANSTSGAHFLTALTGNESVICWAGGKNIRAYPHWDPMEPEGLEQALESQDQPFIECLPQECGSSSVVVYDGREEDKSAVEIAAQRGLQPAVRELRLQGNRLTWETAWLGAALNGLGPGYFGADLLRTDITTVAGLSGR